MGLNSILKTLIKNLKSCYIIFISIWLAMGIILHFPLSNKKEVYEIIYLLYTLSSVFFMLVLGSLIFGSYGKTFILIQNNRKNYVLASLIFSLSNSLMFTLLFIFLRIKPHSDYTNSFSFVLLILIFVIYLFSFYVGSLYGLFVKYNKIIKRISYIVLFFGFVILSYFISFKSLELINVLINFEHTTKTIIYIVIFGILDVISILICNLYYIHLNILKAYSIE